MDVAAGVSGTNAGCSSRARLARERGVTALCSSVSIASGTFLQSRDGKTLWMITKSLSSFYKSTRIKGS